MCVTREMRGWNVYMHVGRRIYDGFVYLLSRIIEFKGLFMGWLSKTIEMERWNQRDVSLYFYIPGHQKVSRNLYIFWENDLNNSCRGHSFLSDGNLGFDIAGHFKLLFFQVEQKILRFGPWILVTFRVWREVFFYHQKTENFKTLHRYFHLKGLAWYLTFLTSLSAGVIFTHGPVRIWTFSESRVNLSGFHLKN